MRNSSRLALVIATAIGLTPWNLKAQTQYPSTSFEQPRQNYGLPNPWFIWNNYADALAGAVNADTAMRLRLQLEQEQQEANRRHHERLVRNQQRATNYGKSTHERLLGSPTPADVERGSALNAILDQINASHIPQAAFSHATTSISRELLANIWFFHAPSSTTFNLGRLTDQDSWPAALQGESLASARQSYQAAAQQAITEATTGTLPPKTIQAVQETVDLLYLRFEQTPPTNRKEYGEAKDYLKTLRTISHGLDKPIIKKLLAKLGPAKQLTTGDLLGFMRTAHLRFNPAPTPKQKLSYHELHAIVAADRDEILAAVAAKHEKKPAAKTNNAKP